MIELSDEQLQALRDMSKAIPGLKAELARAEAAGIDVESHRLYLEQQIKKRDALLKIYGKSKVLKGL